MQQDGSDSPPGSPVGPAGRKPVSSYHAVASRGCSRPRGSSGVMPSARSSAACRRTPGRAPACGARPGSARQRCWTIPGRPAPPGQWRPDGRMMRIDDHEVPCAACRGPLHTDGPDGGHQPGGPDAAILGAARQHRFSITDGLFALLPPIIILTDCARLSTGLNGTRPCTHKGSSTRRAAFSVSGFKRIKMNAWML